MAIASCINPAKPFTIARSSLQPGRVIPIYRKLNVLKKSFQIHL